VFQVWDGLSSGQAAAISHAGPHQSQPPTGFSLLCDQSACSTLPALFPLHEVSDTHTHIHTDTPNTHSHSQND